jgi:hypothetical protein
VWHHALFKAERRPKMIQYFMRSQLLGFLLVPACVAFGNLEYDEYPSHRVNCKAVFSDGLNNASIEVNFRSANSLTPLSDALSLFVLRVSDLDKFDNIFSLKELGFDWLFEEPYGKIELKKEYQGKDVFNYNGFPDIGQLVEIPIPTTGVYCAVITSGGSHELYIDVTPKHSYGYLPYSEYLKHTHRVVFLLLQVGFWVLVGITMASKGISSIRQVAIVPRSFLLYLYLPISIFTAVAIGHDRFANSAARSRSSEVYVHMLSFVDECLGIATKYFSLLVAMGYGTIYCMDFVGPQLPADYRTMPARFRSRCVNLFFINVVAYSVTIVADKYSREINYCLDVWLEYYDNPPNYLAKNLVESLSQLIVVFMPLVWLVATTFYYVRTWRMVRHYNVDATKPFRLSALLLFVLPVVLSVVDLAAVSSLAPQSWDDLDFIHKYMVRDEKAYFLFVKVRALRAWVSHSYVILSMLLNYFIWIKDNRGIVTDSDGGVYELIKMTVFGDTDNT